MLEVLLFPLMGNTIMHNLRCIVLITFCKRSNKLQRDNLTSYILHVPLLSSHHYSQYLFNPLNPELNPICYLPALLGAHNFLHVRRIRVKLLTFRLLMSYIYIYIYMEHPFLMFLDHTQRRSTVGTTPLDE